MVSKNRIIPIFALLLIVWLFLLTKTPSLTSVEFAAILRERNRNISRNLNKTYQYKWLEVGNKQLNHKIYSAYFDDRLDSLKPMQYVGSVRIMAILHYLQSGRTMNCVYRHTNRNNTRVTAISSEAIHEHFELKYSAFIITCPVLWNNFPEDVALEYIENPATYLAPTFVPISYPKKLPIKENKDITLCVGPLQNYTDALRVVEFIEAYQLLGISSVYLYNLSASKAVLDALQHYVAQGVVQLFNWELKGYTFEEDLRYGNIFAALNDCLYRSRVVDSMKYVAIVDLDEVLIPFKHRTLPGLVHEMDDKNVAEIIFRNTFFPTWQESNTFTIPEGTNNTFLYTQSLVKRSTILPSSIRTKYVARTKYATEAGNHKLWTKVRGQSKVLDIEEGLLFHYRLCIPDVLKQSPELLTDFRAQRLGSKLWHNVDEACGKIYKDVCPISR